MIDRDERHSLLVVADLGYAYVEYPSSFFHSDSYAGGRAHIGPDYLIGV
jgi:hypothetical protein